MESEHNDPFISMLLSHLSSLAKRRSMLRLLFLKKLIESRIVWPFLLNDIEFKVPVRISKYHESIRLLQCRT